MHYDISAIAFSNYSAVDLHICFC